MNLKELKDVFLLVFGSEPKKTKKITYNDANEQLEFANHEGEKITLNASEIHHSEAILKNEYYYTYSFLYKKESSFLTGIKNAKRIVKNKFTPLGGNVRLCQGCYKLKFINPVTASYSDSFSEYEIVLYFKVK